VRNVIFAVVAVVCWAGAAPLRAGLYNPTEPPVGPAAVRGEIKPVATAAFRDELTKLFTMAIPQPESPSRKHALLRRNELRATEPQTATLEDQVALSAYLIRLGESPEAVNLLWEKARRQPHFMLLSNLATAQQLSGQPAEALASLQQALSRGVWPRTWPGWTGEQLAWYRRAEEYQQKLIRLRLGEARDRRGPAGPADSLDDLFGVQFVGDSGSYEAGRIAAAQRQKLPADAVALVQQLLVWLPGDTRLYWLLGELLNAQGDVSAAAGIFDECIWERRYDVRELRRHRQIVQEARAQSAGPLVALDVPSAPDTPAGWRLDTRLVLTVSVAAGLLLALLAYFQLREIRHRRQGRSPLAGRG
jgi:tetratricopeptide (TPR) repeat protein